MRLIDVFQSKLFNLWSLGVTEAKTMKMKLQKPLRSDRKTFSIGDTITSCFTCHSTCYNTHNITNVDIMSSISLMINDAVITFAPAAPYGEIRSTYSTAFSKSTDFGIDQWHYEASLHYISENTIPRCWRPLCQASWEAQTFELHPHTKWPEACSFLWLNAPPSNPHYVILPTSNWQ